MGHESRVFYLNCVPGAISRELNRDIDFSQVQLPVFDAIPETIRTTRYWGQNRPDFFQKNANENGLDTHVKVLTLPFTIPPSMSRGAASEMKKLSKAGALNILRGIRNTDLARPLRSDIKEKVISECPNICELIALAEEGLSETDLYINALKIDEARASTTQSDSDKRASNLHFDAGSVPLSQFSDPIYQYFANVSVQPRQFRFIPIALPEMTQRLEHDGVYLPGFGDQIRVADILNTYCTNYNPDFETIVVESGQMVIFDGHQFAHDAGKARLRPLLQGKFVPSTEPDFVMTLTSSRYHLQDGYFDPSQSFLTDPGTPKYWEEVAVNLQYSNS